MLAQSFIDHFRHVFQEQCRDRDSTFRAWREPRHWTKLMLGTDAGVLSMAAARWAAEHVPERYARYWEFRKIDLMIVRSFTDDDQSWEFAPVLLVEHENGYDVEVEAWNLASRIAKLKVLVFYHDGEPDLEFKKAKIERVWNSFNEFDDKGEVLLLTAPLTFGAGVKWQRSLRADGAFGKFADV